jgi:pyruvate formate lyase activating enzyme
MSGSDCRGRIHGLETLGTLDGPGLRLVIFMQGCLLRCRYCHNPETWSRRSGHTVTVDELLRQSSRYRPYFGQTGGVTVSGGEPLLQAAWVARLFAGLHRAGMHTALDTSGWFDTSDTDQASAVAALLAETDLVLLDIKSTDATRFAALTGRPIEPLLTFLNCCCQANRLVRIRQVILPGSNDTTAALDDLFTFLARWPTLRIEQLELLGYHTLGCAKWQALGLTYPLDLPPMDPLRLEDLQRQADARLRRIKADPAGPNR